MSVSIKKMFVKSLLPAFIFFLPIVPEHNFFYMLSVLPIYFDTGAHCFLNLSSGLSGT
jgi:hypothetical protein